MQNLTLGCEFNQKLNVCLALPKLQKITLCKNYKGDVPKIFNTIITITDNFNVEIKKIKVQIKQNYDFIEWKSIFYKSIKDLL